jgi:hypothetical protein
MPDERNFEERVADRVHTVNGYPAHEPSEPPDELAGQVTEPAEKATDGWFRDLKDGRLEVMLKTPYTRVRMSGHPDQVWEIVELFEEWTGRQVNGEWKRPPGRGAKPMEGQTDIFMNQRVLEGEPDE